MIMPGNPAFWLAVSLSEPVKIKWFILVWLFAHAHTYQAKLESKRWRDNMALTSLIVNGF